MAKIKQLIKSGLIFRLGGVLLLLAGLASLFIAPIEIQVYAQFEEGGRFAYEGFGFGSLMFGLITVQVIGYYFIALICFAMYFWMKFLAGTAEWLELVAFTLGIACIAIEVFLVPGFGVFGVGGLALTVLGVVLMSQTFVVPRNVYQVEILSRGIWVALGGAAGLIGGFIAIRMMLPHVPMFRGLVMEPVDQVMLEESEKLGDFSYLVGQTGTATTPLHPSGKARFGDQVIQVISDGTAIATGDRVRVCEVHATKVVVEPLEAE